MESYLLGVAADLVSRYDIDGLHLDYLRYPGRNYDDGPTYRRYGKGIPRDAWRRANITRFLGKVGAALHRLKPDVKLGVTPIGIYRNPHGVRGLESYADVFQDTYSWIERKLIDYVVPQLYWPIGGENGDPDFTAMAVEWREQSSGRHLYLGIGSYKDEILVQSERIVDVARRAGADGEAFFRYASIEPVLPFEAYRRKVLPPPMPWKDSIPPSPPAGLSVTREGGVRSLRWTPSPGDESGGYFAVYRMTGDRDGGIRDERLAALLSAEATSMTDSLPDQEEGVWYAVTRVDRAWNESPPVTEARAGPPAAAGVRPPASAGATPPAGGILQVGTPWMERASRRLFLPFRLGERTTVDVAVAGAPPAGAQESFPAAAGAHIVAIDISELRPGVYRARIGAGSAVVEREFRIPR